MVERRLLKCRWLCVFAVLAAVLVPGGGAAAAVLATGGVDVKDGRLDAGVGKGEVTVVVKRRPSWGEVSRRDVECLSAWVCFGCVCLGVVVTSFFQSRPLCVLSPGNVCSSEQLSLSLDFFSSLCRRERSRRSSHFF